MAEFRYKVADATGQVRIQSVDADSESDALAKLRESGLVVLSRAGAAYSGMAEIVRRTRMGGKTFDAVVFTGRLAPLLEANVPLARALKIIHDGGANADERHVVGLLLRGLQEGKRFSGLLREQPERFPVMYASMAEAGEEIGSLSSVLSEVYKFMSESREQKEFLKTSSIYPGVLLTVTVLVILAIFVFFLPFFAGIFTDMGRELPAATQILLVFSHIITGFWWLWVMLLAGAIWFSVHSWHIAERRLKMEALLLRLPVVGGLLKGAQMGRFYRMLAIMFQNHVQLLTSLRIGLDGISFEVIRNSFSHVGADLRAGGTLSAALRKSPFVETEVVQMVEVGEESGEVGAMLIKVAQAQESRLRMAVKRSLALLEPVVLVILALVILLVVLTVFLTILEMNEF